MVPVVFGLAILPASGALPPRPDRTRYALGSVASSSCGTRFGLLLLPYRLRTPGIADVRAGAIPLWSNTLDVALDPACPAGVCPPAKLDDAARATDHLAEPLPR
jgi:hypothetical protein